MSIHRMSLFVLAVCLPLFACSSTSTPANEDSGVTTTTPGTGTAFRGTLTGKTESGIIDVTMPAGAKTSSVHILADPIPANAVTGTINLGNGKLVSLAGTYDATTGTVTLEGGGYTLTGKLTGGTLSGTYTGPNGGGAFALQSTVSGAVAVFCGTYTGDSSGTWNLVQGGDNTLAGSFTDTAKGQSGILSGKLTGSDILLNPQGSTDTAIGKLAGDSVSGTYGPPGGAPKGTWSGTKGACAK